MILKNLSAWEAIAKHRNAPYQAMEVWEQDSFARIEFSASQMSQPNLGHIVENRVIQLALLEQVEQQSNVTLFMPHRCQSMAIGESEVWTTLDNGQSFTSKLIVGADGANSWFVSSKIFRLLTGIMDTVRSSPISPLKIIMLKSRVRCLPLKVLWHFCR
ncbi:2-octaprenyl-3-methyl-6-methoxy-1,4-benzoquinol hydroxylase [Vibrio maritimus]|uniref:2-octaprenyl-3-methyl-6-methoxy-1,4-benzoquinol hydroxylase n=1 Tax=Vibrio maritimus TaxID=990268 RepID=A0A090SXQ9_9VIBR|nr:2-octaprenyl-3-methyl-6-methoxy-1,4-benzoquinol hydroxylase [Vibrio maritimus]